MLLKFRFFVALFNVSLCVYGLFYTLNTQANITMYVIIANTLIGNYFVALFPLKHLALRHTLQKSGTSKHDVIS